MNTELNSQLTQIAFKKTIPFCYGCYKEAPSGRCAFCHSDDLMRLLPGVGCEYGTEWVVKDLLAEALTPADLNEQFEDSIRSCYPETTTVGWMTFDTATLMKEMDPISWDIAKSEWESSEADEGIIVSFDKGGTYYRREDVEDYIENQSE